MTDRTPSLIDLIAHKIDLWYDERDPGFTATCVLEVLQASENRQAVLDLMGLEVATEAFCAEVRIRAGELRWIVVCEVPPGQPPMTPCFVVRSRKEKQS